LKLWFILVVLMSLTISLYAEMTEEEALQSCEKAEVYAFQLNDGGYYKETLQFAKKALKRCSSSSELHMYLGTAYFHLKNFDEAKKNFRQVLEIDPRNEQAADFIKLIEEQEEAKENEIVGELLEYLRDKGFDFLMIFLAFLGGEIIARRYKQCSNLETETLVDTYHHRKRLAHSLSYRVYYVLSRCCFSKNIFTFCFFLEMIVSIIIAMTMLIIWLLVEFQFQVPLFLTEPLNTLSNVGLQKHLFEMFSLMFFLTLLIRFILKVNSLHMKEETFALALVEHLEKLYAEQSYVYFYEVIDHLDIKDYHNLKDKFHNNEIADLIRKYCHCE